MGRQFVQSRKTHALVPRRMSSFCFVQIACEYIETGLLMLVLSAMLFFLQQAVIQASNRIPGCGIYNTGFRKMGDFLIG